jgi:hypothetical protein
VVCADEAVVCILQVRLKGYDCLLSHFFYLLLHAPYVFASFLKSVNDGGVELLGAVVIIVKLI